MSRAAHSTRELPTTSWSLIAEAAHETDQAHVAMAEFARRYHAPVHAYVRALTHDADFAIEITQSFFSDRILGRRLLEQADRVKGSFRPFLKQAVRNFCVDAFRKRAREVAHIGAPGAAWEDLPSPGAGSRPDEAFHVAWVRELLVRALERVRLRCVERGQVEHLEIFVARYLGAEDRSWAELGERFGLDEKSARGRAETVSRQFRRALRELVTVETGSPSAADEEIAMLLAQF
jgi:DNA-directed RNA polymerase specialized sigma24 family protein